MAAAIRAAARSERLRRHSAEVCVAWQCCFQVEQEETGLSHTKQKQSWQCSSSPPAINLAVRQFSPERKEG